MKLLFNIVFIGDVLYRLSENTNYRYVSMHRARVSSGCLCCGMQLSDGLVWLYAHLMCISESDIIIVDLRKSIVHFAEEERNAQYSHCWYKNMPSFNMF